MTLTRQTFYAQIAANRRNSILLVLVVMALLAVLGFSIGYATSGYVEAGFLVLVFALVLAGFLSAGSYFAGDSLVLTASRAREVTERDAPQLMNVVRELTIAANVPMPRVHIIDDTAPNAFATGRSPDRASIAITTGLLE